jgi:hypothetical protein
MKPFSTEVWFGDRVGVLGSNGSGKSHFLRLLATGGTDPEREHLPVSDVEIAEVPHEGTVKLGARIRPASLPRPTSGRTCWARPCWKSCTAATNTAPGWAARQQPERWTATAGGTVRAEVRVPLRRPAGPVPDPAAAAVRRHAAAPGRAHRQPGPALGRGLGAGHRPLRGHCPGRHARPLVRPHLRPLPGLRLRRQGVRIGRAGLGREAGGARPLTPSSRYEQMITIC